MSVHADIFEYLDELILCLWGYDLMVNQQSLKLISLFYIFKPHFLPKH